MAKKRHYDTTTAVVEPVSEPEVKKATPAEEEQVTFMVKSNGTDARMIDMGNGKKEKRIECSLNSEKFTVPTDRMTSLSRKYYNVIEPLVKAQQGLRYKGEREA